MVKAVKEAVQEVVEGKKQNIELHGQERYSDIKGGTEKLTITHEDIAGYSVNAEFVAVITKDGTTHIYMVRDIEYIKHYSI